MSRPAGAGRSADMSSRRTGSRRRSPSRSRSRSRSRSAERSSRRAAASSSSSAAAAVRPASPPPPRPLLVASYNHKGGVGKTTFLVNLAATYSQRSIRVLMVDADPQCNLTSFFSGPDEGVSDNDSDEDEGMETEDEAPAAAAAAAGASARAAGPRNPKQLFSEKIFAPFPNVFSVPVTESVPADFAEVGGLKTEPNLYSALAPLYNGDRRSFEEGADSLSPDPTMLEGVFLLRGHPNITLFEEQLSSHNAGNSVLSVTHCGALRRLVTQMAQRIDAAIVLIDFGPASGVQNRIWVMSCDLIAPCCFGDYFSVSSIETLVITVLKEWIKWQETYRKAQKVLLKDAGNRALLASYECLKTPPRLLPFMICRFKSVKRGRNRRGRAQPQWVTQSNSAWIAVIQKLLEEGGKAGQLSAEVKSMFLPFGADMVIPFIEDMGALVSLAHRRRLAFKDITDEQLTAEFGKHTIPAYRVKMVRTAKQFEELATRISDLAKLLDQPPE